MENPPPIPGAKKILVVDDNQVVLKSMYFMLKDKGYSVTLAETGSETITLIRKDKPDLILLDLDFPPDSGNLGGGLRDGFLIIDWARRMCDAEKVPVIIISSLDPAQYKDRASAAGIPTFFRKPVDRQQLMDAVHAILHDPPTGTAA